MIQKFRNLLLRICIRLLDGPLDSQKPDEKEMDQIRRWMIESYSHPGYQLWFRYRHAKFVKTLSDLGMEAQPRDNYVRVIGQRFESLRQNDMMMKVFNAKSAKEREKINAENIDK